MNCLGWTNFHVSQQTGQLIVYYTESWRRNYHQGNMHWIEVLHTLAFHSQWMRLGAPDMYYDVIALAAAADSRETRQGETTSGGRHDDLSSLHVTALDQSYFCMWLLLTNHISLFVISILIIQCTYPYPSILQITSALYSSKPSSQMVPVILPTDTYIVPSFGPLPPRSSTDTWRFMLPKKIKSQIVDSN